jgi:DNA-binding transcriptional LysR family regulator
MLMGHPDRVALPAPIPFRYDSRSGRSCYAEKVSLDQLNYFVAVAEEGNIGRAARRLHISQPPLSRQIRSLENELGVTLFLRTAQGVQLLPAGHQLLPRARDILDAVAGVRLCVRRTADCSVDHRSHAAARQVAEPTDVGG